MSLQNDRSTATNLGRKVAALRAKEAEEMKKEADATRRANAATASAQRASSAGSARMYLGNAEREQRNIEAARTRRARYAADVARKTQDLARIQERIAKGEETARKALADTDAKRRREDEKARDDLRKANVRLRKEYDERVAGLEAQIAAQLEAQAARTLPFNLVSADGETEPYDFFLSHAWADKADFADAFVAKARAKGLRVWYDRFAIQWGDSVRQKIDEGLRSCYFGVVLLSPNFFARSWTQYELDGIVQRDLSGQGRLLPIWHHLSQDEVKAKAPSIAGRLALSTANFSTDGIVDELIRMRDHFKTAMHDGARRGRASLKTKSLESRPTNDWKTAGRTTVNSCIGSLS